MYQEMYAQTKLAELRESARSRRPSRHVAGLPGAEIARPAPSVRFEVFRRIAEGG